jgi:hypothetical protein
VIAQSEGGRNPSAWASLKKDSPLVRASQGVGNEGGEARHGGVIDSQELTSRPCSCGSAELLGVTVLELETEYQRGE